MESNEVYELVSIEFKQWNHLQGLRGWEVDISGGAIKAISQMVINIEDDPSSLWRDINTEQTQLYAIHAIQNILNDIFLRHGRMRGRNNIKKITSWEIWHGISDSLDSWCPIPKEF